MKKAIFRRFAAILAAALALSSVLSVAVFGMRQSEGKSRELGRIALIAAESFDPVRDNDAQADALSATLGGVRVTVIAPDGTVTGDSTEDFSVMENHGGRPEIMEAKGTRSAVSVRQSGTLGTRLIYAAIKTGDGFFLRLSERYSGLFTNYLSLLPWMIPVVLVSLCVFVFFAGRFAENLSGHITAISGALAGVKDGGAPLDPAVYPYEELQDIAVNVNALSADIGVYIGKLREEKKRTGFILDNMNEGIILLDNSQTVLFINDRACAFLDCEKSVTGRDITFCARNADFLRAAETAREEGRHVAIDMALEGRVVEAAFVYVPKGSDSELIVTMTDVTEARASAKMRRDFFTNASHELKTPITSIKGSAELLLSDIRLDDEQQKDLLRRMGAESERLCSIINDIIMINRAESGEPEVKERLDMAEIVCECCEEAMPLARQNDIAINIKTIPSVIYANRKNMFELAGNLIMNAVKYNRRGGSVDVSVTCCEKTIALVVRNDGEPIPPEHQSRVFERFYRVDKGRDRNAGGTGLGLSIVKHIAESHGGSVKLQSGPENGTLFTVSLPRSI